MKVRAANAIKSSAICVATATYCLILSLPLAVRVLAQEVPAAELEPVCVAPDGVRSPTGSAAHTYAYDCTINSWQNAYYIWDSTTGLPRPKNPPEHRFNVEQNRWEVYEWVYIVPLGSYAYEMTSTFAPAVSPASSQEFSPTDPSPEAAATAQTTPTTNDSGTPTDSQIEPIGLTVPLDQKNSQSLLTSPFSGTTLNVGLDASLNSTLGATATSGDVAVLQNTTGGNATSGNATVTANVMNMIQSTFGWQGLMPDIYTANIQGNYYGDIMLDPKQFSGIQTQGCGCDDLTVNTSVDGTIYTNINLLAKSGDATVEANTKAGNATTGDASTVANIVNMINSSITAGQSFIGVLNIHGNFEGDVLLPKNVIDTLIAANVPTVDISHCTCGDLTADLDTDIAITNDITATAESGSASVTQNTTAGNAASGNTETNVTVFNLTGRSVVGRDALLVFVNVSGEWIGFITDAPQDATAAAVGGGLRSLSATAGNTEYSGQTSATIHNNINVGAYSGDAAVRNNTLAGDARSGNAYAGVNVGNIAGSHFSLDGWFGLLFINVFGDWYGSFGTDTPYGNPLIVSPPTTHEPIPVTPAYEQQQNMSNRPSPTAVRTFAVSFQSNDAGDAVLASATEIDQPDISQPVITNSDSSNPPTTTYKSQNFVFLLLMGLLVAAYIVVTQTDLASRLSVRS